MYLGTRNLLSVQKIRRHSTRSDLLLLSAFVEFLLMSLDLLLHGNLLGVPLLGKELAFHASEMTRHPCLLLVCTRLLLATLIMCE
jgi:hypothetical protein